MKTYSQKPAEVTRVWYVIDATEAPLGRISTAAASLLLGKGKPTVTAHVDGGDYVIIINAAKLVVTGDKLQKKIYYRHTGYMGHLRETPYASAFAKSPMEVLRLAVFNMLPKNWIRQDRLNKLKIEK